ncbi:unnamed protein product [Linum trigynum]|uniref:Uncharacterized protein n=1 Tax=Linum trigynum TaxID=586398 RepID=A0AAV2CAT3_9ROSI
MGFSPEKCGGRRKSGGRRLLKKEKSNICDDFLPVVDERIQKVRKLIGETPEAIPGVILLIKNGNPCGKKNVVVALFGLLMYQGTTRECGERRRSDSNRSRFGTDKEELVADSMAVLASLAETVEGTIEIVRYSRLAVAIKVYNRCGSCVARKSTASRSCGLCARMAERKWCRF